MYKINYSPIKEMGHKQSKCCCLKESTESPISTRIPSELLGGISNEKNLDKLIQRHIIGSKLTISEKCSGCDGKVALLWEKGFPKFIHQENSLLCTADQFRNCAAYRLAKKYIKHYFNRGGRIIFTTRCRICDKEVKTHLPLVPFKAVENVLHVDDIGNEHVFDIGIITLESSLLLGIDICHTDILGIKDSNLDAMWCSILDIDALYYLTDSSKTPVTIQNYRTDMCCVDCGTTKLRIR